MVRGIRLAGVSRSVVLEIGMLPIGSMIWVVDMALVSLAFGVALREYKMCLYSSIDRCVDGGGYEWYELDCSCGWVASPRGG